ncbi:MAG: response regulator transcription factor [Leptolyngbya sp. SIO1E4]|nr:response regulator transcription factor [Leptolyngbya sp. SIO1E4]
MGQDLPKFSQLKFLIVDDHATVLKGTVSELQESFPDSDIETASSAELALARIKNNQPDLLLLDLSIPSTEGGHAKTEIGLSLLKQLMEQTEDLNVTVLSSYIQRLIMIVSRIERHAGGFTVVDKNLPAAEMIMRVRWALQGITHTKDVKGIRAGIELRPEWLQVLKLAFEHGLQDKAIAEKMSISTRTVRLYFNKLQDALGIYPEDYGGQINLRIQTGIEARKMGLIEDVIRKE